MYCFGGLYPSGSGLRHRNGALRSRSAITVSPIPADWLKLSHDMSGNDEKDTPEGKTRTTGPPRVHCGCQKLARPYRHGARYTRPAHGSGHPQAGSQAAHPFRLTIQESRGRALAQPRTSWALPGPGVAEAGIKVRKHAWSGRCSQDLMQPGSKGIAVGNEGSQEAIQFPSQGGKCVGVLGLVGLGQAAVQGIQVGYPLARRARARGPAARARRSLRLSPRRSPRPSCCVYRHRGHRP